MIANRSLLILTVMIAMVPTFATAGVIVNTEAQLGQTESQISANSSMRNSEPAPLPSSPSQFKDAIPDLGMSGNGVTIVFTSPNAIRSYPVSFNKATPDVESVFSLRLWHFIPDFPVLKIPKIPIA